MERCGIPIPIVIFDDFEPTIYICIAAVIVGVVIYLLHQGRPADPALTIPAVIFLYASYHMVGGIYDGFNLYFYVGLLVSVGSVAWIVKHFQNLIREQQEVPVNIEKNLEELQSQKMGCRCCGKEINETDEECPWCGAEVTPMTTCRQCNRKIALSQDTCVYCGTPLWNIDEETLLSLLQDIAPPEKADTDEARTAADLLQKGDLLIQQGRYKEALKCYGNAGLHAPHSIKSLIGRGIAWILLSDFREGIGFINRAIELDPENTKLQEARSTLIKLKDESKKQG